MPLSSTTCMHACVVCVYGYLVPHGLWYVLYFGEQHIPSLFLQWSFCTYDHAISNSDHTLWFLLVSCYCCFLCLPLFDRQTAWFLSLTAKQKNLLFTSNLYFSSSQSSNQASLCCDITWFTLISVCLWDCPEHVWEEAVSSITSDIWDSCMSSGRCLKRGIRWCCV